MLITKEGVLHDNELALHNSLYLLSHLLAADRHEGNSKKNDLAFLQP